MQVDAKWEKYPWMELPALVLTHHMGDKPDHFPRVQVRLAYDAAAIYVIFRVADRYVRALTQNYQDAVFFDSCVEFFFTPGEDVRQGYFNLEMNCGGTTLFHHQTGRRQNDVAVSAADFAQVQVAHTLPKIVHPEIEKSVIWVVEYCLPFKILARYASVARPSTGVVWRANFYKCADASSHPHWLSWSPVKAPEPDFHRPEYFGQLVFG
jgi:hypothetical protein